MINKAYISIHSYITECCKIKRSRICKSPLAHIFGVLRDQHSMLWDNYLLFHQYRAMYFLINKYAGMQNIALSNL